MRNEAGRGRLTAPRVAEPRAPLQLRQEGVSDQPEGRIVSVPRQGRVTRDDVAVEQFVEGTVDVEAGLRGEQRMLHQWRTPNDTLQRRARPIDVLNSEHG